MNKLYDIILAKYEEYISYNKIVEQEKEKIAERDKEIAALFFKENESSDKTVISDKLKSLFIEKLTFLNVLSQDAKKMFYDLYTLVSTYTELPEAPILPERVIKLCDELAYTVPKTVMIVEKDKLQEREKGALDKLIKFNFDNGNFDHYLKVYTEQIKDKNNEPSS